MFRGIVCIVYVSATTYRLSMVMAFCFGIVHSIISRNTENVEPIFSFTYNFIYNVAMHSMGIVIKQ